jgi:adenylosuccinate lyase
VIERYTRPEMGRIWQPSSRFHYLLQVEVAVAQAQSEAGLIPKEAYQAIRDNGRFDLQRIAEIEQQTKHDVIAFVSNVAENVGPHGRYVHYCLTSSDALDTALSLQILKAGEGLQKELAVLEKVLFDRAREFRETLCAGRTHGMHAEPTSFGLKLAGFCEEIRRNQQRLAAALRQIAVGKLSGAVGTFSALSPKVEARALEILHLHCEPVATQVLPRDRHAEVLFALATLGAALERLAIELRHLQRTEVGEAYEGFQAGQKGSSAMPHKRNPISAENITGCARLLRSYLQASLENVALWHERDISHSSVERVIFPDAFILADYAVDRMTHLVRHLEVQPERMLANMALSRGQLMSSHLLLRLVDKGLTREAAYALVQKLSFAPGLLKETAQQDDEVAKLLSQQELDEIFSGREHQTAIGALVDSWLKGERA